MFNRRSKQRGACGRNTARAALRGVSACTLMTAALCATASAAPKPSGPPTGGTVATPAAATLPEVVMTCEPGQTDINSASVDELTAAFAISAPIAGRVAGLRPYIAVTDLLVVEGIGKGTLAGIVASGRGCATPPSEPPPAPSACSTPDTVDLQSAPADDIARVTGINANAAARLVDARPYAKLDHVTPERVPGVGKGILDAVIARSCLTPQPIRAERTTWRWAYPAYTTTAVRDGYRLQAPAGVIDAARGAWLSITPLPVPASLPGPSYPRADFHIFGAWSGPRQPGASADEVLVTVPAATFANDFDPADFTPYLKHTSSAIPGGGENVHAADKVRVDPATGAVTGALTSLSVIDWAVRGLNYLVEPATGALFGNRFPGPTCNGIWPQRPGTNIHDSPDGARATVDSALLDTPGSPVPLAGFLIKHCVQTGEGHGGYRGQPDARVLLRNSSGTVQSLRRASGDVSVALQPQGFDIDIVAKLVTSVNTGGRVFLAPGQTGSADVPAGTFANAPMQPDRLRSLLKIGADKTLGYVFDRFSANAMYSDPTIYNKLVQIVSCAYNSYNAATSGNGFANASRDFAKALYECVDYESVHALIESWMRAQLAAGRLDGAGAVRIHKGLEHLREIVKWVEFGQVAVDVSDSLIWGSLGTVPVLIEHYAAKPTRDDLGRLVRSQCVREHLYAWQIDAACQNAAYTQQSRPTGGGGDTGFPLGKMIRDTDGHAWLVTDADKKMHAIEDGGTYICLSKHYAIDWGLDFEDLRAYRQESGPNGDPATCDGSRPATRKITAGEAPDLFAVLRIEDGPESWIVFGGARYHIPSGGQFNCWVNPQFRANMEVDVYDFVSRGQLETWPVGSGSIDNCGDPEHPSF